MAALGIVGVWTKMGRRSQAQKQDLDSQGQTAMAQDRILLQAKCLSMVFQTIMASLKSFQGLAFTHLAKISFPLVAQWDPSECLLVSRSPSMIAAPNQGPVAMPLHIQQMLSRQGVARAPLLWSALVSSQRPTASSGRTTPAKGPPAAVAAAACLPIRRTCSVARTPSASMLRPRRTRPGMPRTLTRQRCALVSGGQMRIGSQRRRLSMPQRTA